MIDEPAQDLAALHALGLLDDAEAAEFARRAAADPELHGLAAELREVAAALALAAPRAVPPERLKTEFLARVAEPLRPDFRPRVPTWIPWAAAALFLALCGGLLGERVRLQGELARLRAVDATTQLQLRALQAAAGGGQGFSAVAVVAWDPVRQRGLLEVQRLPVAGADRDYQLWVIDPAREQPVSAGIFRPDAGGHAEVRFQPVTAGLKAVNFAVSLEPTGGSPQATGPILLVGQ